MKLRQVPLHCVSLVASIGMAAAAPSVEQLQSVAEAAHAKFKNLEEGKNADYIPALAKVPSELFGIAIVTKDGDVVKVGDTDAV